MDSDFDVSNEHLRFYSIDDLTEINPDTKKTIDINQANFDNDNYSALKLFEFDYDELPKLLDPIFPKVGLASLVGSSDTGKSTLLRQLAISVALGLDKFIGYKLNAKTRNVIFISTEDDPVSTSVSIKKPIKKLLRDNKLDKSVLNHLKFIFDVDFTPEGDKNIFRILNKDLSTAGADLIVVDAFTDVFSGDINSSTKVREFLNQFSKLSKAYNCLILFLHHTGKRTDKYSASKNNVLGSQAFEAKMRVLIELRHFPKDETKRTLTITKGNYISSNIKKYSKILTFNENELLFYDTGKVILSSLTGNSKENSNKDKLKKEVEKLFKEGMTVRKIEDELRNRGEKISKSTIATYIKEIKTSQENIKEPISKYTLISGNQSLE